MAFKVIGYQHQDIQFKDGRTVNGYKLHLTEPRNGVTGFAADSVFLSDQKAGEYKPQINDILEIIWNRWGKIDGVKLVK